MTTAQPDPHISQDVLDALLAVGHAPPGPQRLASAVDALSRLLRVKCAFVAETLGEPPTRGRTLAMCMDGAIVDNFEYPLAGTPCDHARGDEMCFFGSDVQSRFPEDVWLVDVGAQSYMAVPYAEPTGEHIGHLGIIHTEPIERDLANEGVFRVFAALVGAELNSRRLERKQLEMERKVLEGHRLESLGVLAGGVAHDFNNLLVGVTGNISLALMDSSASSPIRHYLEEIESTAKRAADLAEQMLAYSGKGRFIVADTSLNDIVEEMMNLFTVSIPKNVVLRYDLSDELPAVRADVTQVRQLVMNLVLNAAEAIEDKSGTISITSGVVRVDEDYLAEAVVGRERAVGDYVFLEVADSGCGLTPEVKLRMFDPFFTKKPSGRGLGLAAVQGIVNGHDGVLKVYSEVGKGTTFKLLLPASGNAVAESSSSVLAQLDLRGQMALVVDDDETVQATTARILERVGCSVIVAEDGRRGVELFRSRADEIDFVLLDMTMPKMGGEEAFRQMKRIRADVRVILMSGYNEQDATSHFAGKGLAGFLQKPFTVESLVEQLAGGG